MTSQSEISPFKVTSRIYMSLESVKVNEKLFPKIEHFISFERKHLTFQKPAINLRQQNEIFFFFLIYKTSFVLKNGGRGGGAGNFPVTLFTFLQSCYHFIIDNIHV